MVTCIVQARMSSERLKGKVLKEILDHPMIIITLKRLQRSKYVDKIILATSDKEEDTPLYEKAKSEGFEVFRGSEDNVLQRYVECAQQYGGDSIVRITGDCPLIDPIMVDHVISYYSINEYDYVRFDVPHTMIRGFDVEIFSKEALLKTYGLAEKKEHKEHVTYYMYTHPEEFRIGLVHGQEFYNKEYRICVDTQEDFTVVTKIFEHFKDIFVTSKQVVRFLDNNPKVAVINQAILQKKN